MAKIAYTKLALAPKKDVKVFEYNGQSIEVIQYLPLDQKLDVLTKVINNSGDDQGFYNRAKIEFNIILEMVFAYTNITFTEKQKENRTKLYDALVGSGFWNYVMEVLPKDEWDWFNRMTLFTIDKIYEYRNSVYGILDAMKTDYNDLDLDATKIRDELADENNLSLVRNVLEKLG